ncbi:single-stranded DNA-binding protein [Microbacterium oryzae]|uniref:single-stranded DNA-binding protein n=1 Tax=Microbacterium oryzae TaxID=743009 RepID=UPI0025B0B09A|nr:single-stranded DNA-binding protein [Microbacterium oryzae]MDN3309478.1 single-stranded DNA-binding protein [Microbacterium oryzae]
MTDQIVVVGNITNDPTSTTLADGTAVLRFRLATNPRRYVREKAGWVEDPPNFYKVSAFRSLASNGALSLSKGMRVLVTGRLRVRPWENDKGAKGTDVEITADNLAVDLLFGTVSYSKNAAGGEIRREEPEQTQEPDMAWSTAPLGEPEMLGEEAERELSPF